MTKKASRHNLILRPHFKTHQSRTIGRWFRNYGVEKITVSSLGMAAYFAEDGWNDIAIAFPFNIHEVNEARELAQNTDLKLSVCSAEVLEFISRNFSERTGIYIKTDTGYNRTGISVNDSEEINKMLDIIKKSTCLYLHGFMVHNGHTYHAGSTDEINRIHKDSIAALGRLKTAYIGDHPQMILSTGDTPACSISDFFEGIDEIRPGNYVFYDLMQSMIGSCRPSQVAVALAVPVVAKHRDRMEIVVYGGAVHFSKEHIVLNGGTRIFGQVAESVDNGWSDPLPGVWLTSVSQEHGIIKCNEEFFNSVKPGDFLKIIPVHSCLTANLMRGYTTTEGENHDHYSSF